MNPFMSKNCIIAAILLAAAGILQGCAGNYGQLVRDAKTNESFLKGDVSSDYDYFYTGPEKLPSAILKIDKNYELVSDLWAPLDFAEDNLGKWVENLRFYHGDRGRNRPYGYKIIDCEGKNVGGWYSAWDWTAVKCLEGDKIEVFPPPLGDPRDDYDDDKIILRPRR